jgi:DNA-binding CsgD family transcriptional regulator
MNSLNPNSLANKVNALDPTQILKEETEKVGIDFLMHFAVKTFFSNGFVLGETSNIEWNKFINQPDILRTSVKKHYSHYLRLTNNKNYRYQIRRREDANTDFLGYLSDYDMCNSLTVYVRYHNCIKTYFFVAEPNDKIAINFFYNNFPLFEKIIKNTEQRIQRESYSKSFILPQGTELFTTSDRQLIFEKQDSYSRTQTIGIYRNNQELQFTKHEYRILKQIQTFDTLKNFSKKMHLSPGALDFHLCNLRRKAKVHSTKDLAQFAIEIQELI